MSIKYRQLIKKNGIIYDIYISVKIVTSFICLIKMFFSFFNVDQAFKKIQSLEIYYGNVRVCS